MLRVWDGVERGVGGWCWGLECIAWLGGFKGAAEVVNHEGS